MQKLFLIVIFFLSFSVGIKSAWAITPDACTAQKGTCLGGATATCGQSENFAGTCVESGNVLGPCCVPKDCVSEIKGTCSPQCDTSTQQQVVGSCSGTQKCCVQSAGSGGGGSVACANLPGGGSCQPQCPNGTQISSAGTCSGTFKCCVSQNVTTPPNVQAVTFSNLLKYDTVNGLLGSILTWLQGIIATLALVFIVIGGFLYITSGGDSGRTETAKKCITAAVIGFALAIAAPSFLKEIGNILGWGPAAGNLPPGVGTSLTLLEILTKAMNFLLSVVGIIAIIMLVVGGFMYLTAAGDEDQIDRAKALVKYAVIGIFVALAALVIVSQVAKFFA